MLDVMSGADATTMFHEDVKGVTGKDGRGQAPSWGGGKFLPHEA